MNRFDQQAMALTQTLGSAGLTRLYSPDMKGGGTKNAPFSTVYDRDCEWFRFTSCKSCIREAGSGEFAAEGESTFAVLGVTPPTLWCHVVKVDDKHIVTPLFRGTPPPCKSVSWYSKQEAWGNTACIFKEYVQAMDDASVARTVYELHNAGGYNKVEMVSFVQQVFTKFALYQDRSTSNVKAN